MFGTAPCGCLTPYLTPNGAEKWHELDASVNKIAAPSSRVHLWDASTCVSTYPACRRLALSAIQDIGPYSVISTSPSPPAARLLERGSLRLRCPVHSRPHHIFADFPSALSVRCPSTTSPSPPHESSRTLRRACARAAASAGLRQRARVVSRLNSSQSRACLRDHDGVWPRPDRSGAGSTMPTSGRVDPRPSIEAGTRPVWAAEAAAPRQPIYTELLVVPVVMALD